MRYSDFLPGRLGLGTAPLGNMYRDVPEADAAGTLEAAWDAGVRYYDTAPFYGAGLAELRLGRLLSGRPREAFVVSGKVGRVVHDEVESGDRDLGEKGGLFAHGRPNRMETVYIAEATERSVEDSLRRLGVDRLDAVHVHDVAQDFHGDLWVRKFEEARTGAFRVLDRLRDEGVIRAWGVGVNRTEPIETTLALDEPRPDGFLLAGRYTLLDHEHALERLLPMAAARGVEMVVGGPYSSGVLAGGSHFEYQPAPPEIRERVRRIHGIADRHGVHVKAAALQFPLAHPVAAAVVAGATHPGRIAEDQEALREEVPAAFWREMRDAGLVSARAPLPGGV